MRAHAETRTHLLYQVKIMTAAAPPSASTLEKMQKQGFDVTHVYGLTETYGPAVICSWDPEWSNHSLHDQAVLRARQGVQYHALEDLQASFIHMYACGSVWEYFNADELVYEMSANRPWNVLLVGADSH